MNGTAGGRALSQRWTRAIWHSGSGWSPTVASAWCSRCGSSSKPQGSKMDLPLDFRELLEEFAREGVEYLIVGGYAVAFHARPRATKDLDILLGASPGNLDRAAAALA